MLISAQLSDFSVARLNICVLSDYLFLKEIILFRTISITAS